MNSEWDADMTTWRN